MQAKGRRSMREVYDFLHKAGFCFLAGGKGKDTGEDNGEYDRFSHCLNIIDANIVIFL